MQMHEILGMAMFRIDEIIDSLASKKPIFELEDDFQYALARKIVSRYPDVTVLLEGMPLDDTHSFLVDIYFKLEWVDYFLELKYKPNATVVSIKGKNYHLTKQAEDLSCYDFVYDIYRLEKLTASRDNAVGYALFLTNHSLYWRGTDNKASDYYPFQIAENRILEKTLAWQNRKEKKDKDRQLDLELKGRYHLRWRTYSDIGKFKPVAIDTSEFKYLLVRIPNRGSNLLRDS